MNIKSFLLLHIALFFFIILLNVKPIYAQYDPPPSCDSFTPNTNPINSGSSTLIRAINCIDRYPGPVPTPFNYPTPDIGTYSNPTGGQVTYTAPTDTCSTEAHPQVQVYGPGGSTTYSTTININTLFNVQGTVYFDSDSSNCATNPTPVNNLGTLTLYRGGTSIGSDTTDGSGDYSITSTTTCTNNHHLIISGISGYEVRGVRVDAGSWTTSGLSGADYGPFAFPPSKTIDWCISNIRPWFRTDRGDVRMNSITNPVPAGLSASTAPNYPSIFFSNGATLDFVNGSPSSKGWVVRDEYSRNAKSANTLGSFSYSFYKSRAAQNNITTTPLCAGSLSNCSISGLQDGEVYEINGDVNITGFAAFPANSHVVILVNGTTTISTNISVPAGQCSGNTCNLLILASRGNITIDGSVGTTPGNSATQLEGIYSSEGSIILEDLNDCPTADNRLNIGGALIANARAPFSQSGSGSIQNNRSLCASDQTNPTYSVSLRSDFITQLTDFYKATSSKWQEVQP